MAPLPARHLQRASTHPQRAVGGNLYCAASGDEQSLPQPFSCLALHQDNQATAQASRPCPSAEHGLCWTWSSPELDTTANTHLFCSKRGALLGLPPSRKALGSRHVHKQCEHQQNAPHSATERMASVANFLLLGQALLFSFSLNPLRLPRLRWNSAFSLDLSFFNLHLKKLKENLR